MIAALSGDLSDKSPPSITVNVGGVGYHVKVSLSTYSKLPDVGHTVNLRIHTHVREDQISLFGFIDNNEKDMFLKLITISGVGPKLALSILSGIETIELESAISSGEASRIQLIPGVGKKTAERIVIELKDKIKFQTPHTTNANQGIYNDALSALLNLGYQRSTSVSALNQIQWDKNMTLEGLIRLAFKELK